MHAKTYDQTIHLPIIHGWLKKRECRLPPADEMPEIGYVVYIEEVPVAYASVRRCEGGYALLDGLTSNPEASSSDRHQAIDFAVETCITVAKYIGFSTLLAFTVDAGTLNRSDKHGFVRLPHATMALNLKGNNT